MEWHAAAIAEFDAPTHPRYRDTYVQLISAWRRQTVKTAPQRILELFLDYHACCRRQNVPVIPRVEIWALACLDGRGILSTALWPAVERWIRQRFAHWSANRQLDVWLALEGVDVAMSTRDALGEWDPSFPMWLSAWRRLVETDDAHRWQEQDKEGHLDADSWQEALVMSFQTTAASDSMRRLVETLVETKTEWTEQEVLSVLKSYMKLQRLLPQSSAASVLSVVLPLVNLWPSTRVWEVAFEHSQRLPVRAPRNAVLLVCWKAYWGHRQKSSSSSSSLVSKKSCRRVLTASVFERDYATTVRVYRAGFCPEEFVQRQDFEAMRYVVEAAAECHEWSLFLDLFPQLPSSETTADLKRLFRHHARR